MRRKYRNILLLIFLIISSSCVPNSDTFVKGVIGDELIILPSPKTIKTQSGDGLDVATIHKLYISENIFRFPMGSVLNQLSRVNTPGKGVISLELTTENVPESEEGYRMIVSEDQVVVRSRSVKGIFYGCQTFEQLAEDALELGKTIPFCEITDFPDIKYRPIHIDVKHHLDNINYYYDLVDRLSSYKVNAIIFEFEDKLRYKEYGVVGAENAISIQEMVSLSNYAKERNIEISPLIQGLGHAEYILKHDEFKYLRDDKKSDWAFCPLNPDTYKVQFSLYMDAIQATPHGKYLHIGGDEVGELGISELCKASGKTPFELQLYWLRKVCEFAKEHNRIPIFWDDMILKRAGLYKTTYDKSLTENQIDQLWKKNKSNLDNALKLFPDNCVYMRWNYGVPQEFKGNLNVLNWYESNELKAMAATAGQTTFPMLPRVESKITQIKAFSQLASKYNLDGVMCTFWDDSSPHFDTFRRSIVAFAEYSWSPQSEVTVNQLKVNYRHREFSSLAGNPSYEFQDLLEQACDFWDNALLETGTRWGNEYHDVSYISLPSKESDGEWSKKYEERLIQAKIELERYQDIKNRIQSLNEISTKNHYHLDLMNQINELQIFSSKLLLALQAFDLEKNKKKRNQSLFQLSKQISDFNLLRKEYEQVFSQTRYLTNPPSYKLDMNIHHHIANATNNSDWMYMYELEMIKRVKKKLL
ncbi:family 20 glycosylhydrolase [Reichenbachiella sp. MALMAid0571]|uniref:family 20 glycosylhydrolase n=1 Tax=Reichenbachiella sp. MALMAid0571 TaxID=3143939 RepID=UPI0032E018A4